MVAYCEFYLENTEIFIINRNKYPTRVPSISILESMRVPRPVNEQSFPYQENIDSIKDFKRTLKASMPPL